MSKPPSPPNSPANPCTHDLGTQLPGLITRSINSLRILQRLVVIEPIENMIIFHLIKFHLYRLKGLDVKYVTAIIQRRFFVIKRWKTHSFEMPTISFFSSHHDPHGSPLGDVDGLDNEGSFVDEGNGSGLVVKDFDVTDLFPGHRGVLKQLVDGMRYVQWGERRGGAIWWIWW